MKQRSLYSLPRMSTDVTPPTPLEALRVAIDLAGGQTALATKIGGKVKQSHIWNWLNRGDPIPEEVCPLIEQAVDGRVRCEQLRPDRVWTRNTSGRITGYHVPLPANEPSGEAPTERAEAA